MYFINGILSDTHTKNSEKIGYFGYGIGYDTRMISGTLKKTGYQCMTLNKHKLASKLNYSITFNITKWKSL
jgi:3-hydroxy-3-methylglutaryl CoA synthase